MTDSVVVNVPEFEGFSDAKTNISDVYLALYRASQVRETMHEELSAFADLAKASHFMMTDAEAGKCQPYSRLRVSSLARQGFAQFGYIVSGIHEAVQAEQVPDSEDTRLRSVIGEILGIAFFNWTMLDDFQLLRLFTALQRAMERLQGDWAAKVALFYRSVTILLRCKHNDWDQTLFVNIPDFATTAMQPYNLNVTAVPNEIFQ